MEGVLEECSACIKSHTEYTGERRGGSGNHKPLIETGSFYMQMVADCMEEGLGLRTTMERVNKHRVAAGLLHVGKSAVASAYHRACPVLAMVSRVKSGSNDPTDDWSRARFRWVAQLLIRLGVKEFTFEELVAAGVLEKDEIAASKGAMGANYLVWHDALSLMTCKNTREWMEKKGYLEHWVLPELGVNKYWKYYDGNPTGNGPELHWMDNSLNRDVDVVASAHCAETNMLRADDALFGNKFRMDTPGELTRTYTRVWNGDANGAAPSAARIVHDIENWIDVLHRIFDAKGIAVDDRREGRRRATSEGPLSSKWGGLRTKGAYEAGRWLHEDAAAVSELMTARTEQRHGEKE